MLKEWKKLNLKLDYDNAKVFFESYNKESLEKLNIKNPRIMLEALREDLWPDDLTLIQEITENFLHGISDKPLLIDCTEVIVIERVQRMPFDELLDWARKNPDRLKHILNEPYVKSFPGIDRFLEHAKEEYLHEKLNEKALVRNIILNINDNFTDVELEETISEVLNLGYIDLKSLKSIILPNKVKLLTKALTEPMDLEKAIKHLKVSNEFKLVLRDRDLFYRIEDLYYTGSAKEFVIPFETKEINDLKTEILAKLGVLLAEELKKENK